MTRQRPLERRLNGSAPGRSTACIGCKTAGAGDRNETTGFACYYPDHYQDTARMLREFEGEARGYRVAQPDLCCAGGLRNGRRSSR